MPELDRLPRVQTVRQDGAAAADRGRRQDQARPSAAITKTYFFAVVEIRPKGEGCLLLSDQSGGEEDGERLEVARCLPANEAAATQQ